MRDDADFSGNFRGGEVNYKSTVIKAFLNASPSQVAAEQLGAAETRLTELPLDRVPPVGALPAGSIMPLASNPLFVGRTPDLVALAQALMSDGTAAIGQAGAAARLAAAFAADLARRAGVAASAAVRGVARGVGAGRAADRAALRAGELAGSVHAGFASTAGVAARAAVAAVRRRVGTDAGTSALPIGANRAARAVDTGLTSGACVSALAAVRAVALEVDTVVSAKAQAAHARRRRGVDFGPGVRGRVIAAVTSGCEEEASERRWHPNTAQCHQKISRGSRRTPPTRDPK